MRSKAVGVALRSRASRAFKAQRGFTLIELGIVAAIIAFMLVLMMPNIKAKIIENKTSSVATQMQRAVVKIIGSRAGMGTTPYTGIAIAELGQVLRDEGFPVTGSPATAVEHTLGTDAGTPSVTIAAATLNTAGDAFTITMNEVHRAACAGMATAMSGYAEVMTLTAAGGSAATLKAAGGAYNPSLTLSNCGDRNTLALTFR